MAEFKPPKLCQLSNKIFKNSTALSSQYQPTLAHHCINRIQCPTSSSHICLKNFSIFSPWRIPWNSFAYSALPIPLMQLEILLVSSSRHCFILPDELKSSLFWCHLTFYVTLHYPFALILLVQILFSLNALYTLRAGSMSS